MHRRQNSLTKCTRIERLAQLSEQEIVIERKKREIQAKIEAQKKKETEEALKKLESASESKTNSSPFSTRPFWRRYDFRKDSEKEREKEKEKDKKIEEEKEKEEVKLTIPVNAFSNDGSFLDQFKKLSSTGLKPDSVDLETLAKARKKEEDEKDRVKKLEKEIENKDKDFESHRQRRESDRRDSFCIREQQQRYTESFRRSPTRKPLDSNIQLQLPPPGVVQLVPQHQVQMVAPAQIVSVVSSMPTVPPLQTSQNQISNVSPASVGLPTLHQVILNTVSTAPPPTHSFTTNQIQLQAVSSPRPVPPAAFQSAIICPMQSFEAKPAEAAPPPCPPPRPVSPPQQQPLASIRPPLPMTPQNIPPPSPIQVQNIPPPPLPPKKSEETQKIHIGNISLSFKKKNEIENVGNCLDLKEIPTPPPSIFDTSHSERKKKKKKRKMEQISISGCSPPPPGYFEGIPFPETIPVPPEEPPKQITRVSPALSDKCEEATDDEEVEEGKRHLAAMVARCGDDVENLLWIRNQDDPALRFLFEKDSKDYKLYRRLVVKYRQHPELIEKERSFDSFNSLSDQESDTAEEDGEPAEKKERRLSPEPVSNESNKNDSKDSVDVNFNTSLEEFQLEKDAATLHQEVVDDDNEQDTNHYKLPETPDEKQVTNTEKAEDDEVSSTLREKLQNSAKECNKAEERKRKRKSRWGDVAISETASLQNVPSLAQSVTKTHLLTKITRSDPGLIQYARKTFGSINLSEEEWKKAEDHYKINLLYQDMVKKRAEIEKLERAGKFKYEYDSDEDVEGGTWEHKLRQQEMEATQLWAEELTRQSAGKHHIGDFLPPEELEKFMERYNAVKEGREPDLSDYKEFKLKSDNIGYQLLQKMGWNEGQGLGQDGSGITHPVNKATTRNENQGLGVDRPDGLEAGDDEYDAYRKRMMLAYRFRPNPLNNPRRPYY